MGAEDAKSKSDDATSGENAGNEIREQGGPGSDQDGGSGPSGGSGPEHKDESGEQNTEETGTPGNPNKVEPSVTIPASEQQSGESKPSEIRRSGFRFQPSWRRKDPSQ